MTPCRPGIFDYLDYRAFLRDYFAFGKVKYGLSHRGLARRARISSPTFLKLVIEGRRGLAPATATRVAAACSLEGEHAEYFVRLVAFNQTTDTDAKRVAYERLQKFASWRRIHALDLARDRYFSRWYMPAIRELVASPGFVDDGDWIARQFRPRIRAREARTAIATLLELGLIARDRKGRLHQTETTVSSGRETSNVHMASYHRAMMQRASQAIDAIHRDERDLGAITLCVDEAGLARLKERVQEFRRELLLDEPAIAGTRSRVVQINIQLFPLTVRKP